MLEESRNFVVDSKGMFEMYWDETSVYLRCLREYKTYSVQLRQSEQPSAGHTALRAGDCDFFEKVLGMHKTEQSQLDNGELTVVWYRYIRGM